MTHLLSLIFHSSPSSWVAFFKQNTGEPEIIICRQQKLKSSSNWFNYQLNFVPCYVYPKWASEWVSGGTYNSYYTEYLTRLLAGGWWRSKKRLLSNEQPSTGTRKEAESLLNNENELNLPFLRPSSLLLWLDLSIPPTTTVSLYLSIMRHWRSAAKRRWMSTTVTFCGLIILWYSYLWTNYIKRSLVCHLDSCPPTSRTYTTVNLCSHFQCCNIIQFAIPGLQSQLKPQDLAIELNVSFLFTLRFLIKSAGLSSVQTGRKVISTGA